MKNPGQKISIKAIAFFLIITLIMPIAMSGCSCQRTPDEPEDKPNVGDTPIVEENSTPSFSTLTGKFTDREIKSEEAAILAVQDVKEELGLTNAVDELSVQSTNTIDNLTYYRLQQNYNGIPVYGSSVVVISDENGEAQGLTSSASNIETDVSLTPTVTREQVIASIQEYLGENAEITVPDLSDDMLVVYSDDDTENVALAYEIRIIFDGCPYKAIVNAQTGKVYSTYSLVYYDNASQEKTYQQDKRRNIIVYDAETKDWKRWSEDGEIFPEADPNNKRAAQLMEYAQITYDFYADPDLFGLSSFNDKNGELVILVDCSYSETSEDNAMADTDHATESRAMICFGFENIISLDTVAHEYTHITEYLISGMIYRGESGAIMEGYSDIFGELVEDYSDGIMDGNCDWIHGGRHINAPYKSTTSICYYTWTGKTCPVQQKYGNHIDNGTNKVSSSNCNIIPGQPSHVTSTRIDATSSYDHGGVHWNSTIVSHAGYLMTKPLFGGKALTTNELAILWYNTLFTLPKNCSFDALRQNMLMVAKSLNYSEDKIKCITDAFDYAGIDGLEDSKATAYEQYDVNPTIQVYGINMELYDNYTVDIIKVGDDKSENKHIVVKDTKPVKLTISVGKYTITIRDIADESKIYTKNIEIIDFADEGEEDKTIFFATDFGSEPSHTHEYTTETQSQTCTTDGWQREICECGDIKSEKVLPATGHSYVDGVCSACGAFENEEMFVRDGEYIYFGEYPKTIKSDNVIITETQDSRGYYLGSDGYYYAKVAATLYNLVPVKNFAFSTGEEIIEGSIYYFKVEPIRWKILSEENGEALVLCDSILISLPYQSNYYKSGNYYYTTANGAPEGTYASNYKYSNVRYWLNSVFYETAFTQYQKESLILTTEVDNSVNSIYDYGYVGSMNDMYCCETTYDKIFLLSQSDVTNSKYGFKSYDTKDNARIKLTTDYSRATGSYMSTSSNSYGAESWLVRSPYFLNKGDIVRSVGGTSGIANGPCGVYQPVGIVPALRITLNPSTLPEETKTASPTYITSSQTIYVGDDLTIKWNAPSENYKNIKYNVYALLIGTDNNQLVGEHLTSNTFTISGEYFFEAGKYNIELYAKGDAYSWSKGVVLSITVIEEHVHEYETVYCPPSGCEADGYRYEICDCGDKQNYEYLPAAGHTFGEWLPIRIEGSETSTTMYCSECVNCGARTYSSTPPEETKTASPTYITTSQTIYVGDDLTINWIAPSGNYSNIKYNVYVLLTGSGNNQLVGEHLTDTTFTIPGKYFSEAGKYNIELYARADGYSWSKSVVLSVTVKEEQEDAGDHIHDEVPPKEECLKQEGEMKTYYLYRCSGCNSWIVAYVEEEHVHEYIVVYNAPTCTHAGSRYEECYCGETRNYQSIDIKDHDYVNGSCDICGAEEPSSEKPQCATPVITTVNGVEVTLGYGLKLEWEKLSDPTSGVRYFIAIMEAGKDETYTDVTSNDIYTTYYNIPASYFPHAGTYVVMLYARANGYTQSETAINVYVN